MEMGRACTGVNEQERAEQQGLGPLVRAMRVARRCQDVTPRDGCSVRARWLFTLLWANILCLPSIGVSAPFLVAQRSSG